MYIYTLYLLGFTGYSGYYDYLCTVLFLMIVASCKDELTRVIRQKLPVYRGLSYTITKN